MNAKDRARVILEYLANNEVAGTPNIVHHQLELFRDADWSKDTTARRLNDFQVVGWVEYLPDRGKGWYKATDLGRAAHEEGLSDEQLDRIVGISQ